MWALLSVDAGTTGVRTLVIDQSAAIRHVAYRPLTQHFPRPGWVEHDPQEIWDLTRQTLLECWRFLDGHATGLRPAAIGIANQRETTVAWDRRTGETLAPAIVWQDRRTARRCRELAERGLTGLVRRTTGLVLDPYFSATKFEWQLADGAVGRSAGLALGTVDTWLAWQLTGGTDGGRLVTDPSNASRTMLYDIHRARWSEELCDLFGVPLGALAEVVPTCGRIGTVRGAAVEGGPGLRGLPVSAVAGDQQAALFGQGCVVPGMAKVTYGTGSFVLTHAGSTPPPTADGVLTTVAWDLGGHRSGAPGTGPLEYAVEGSTFVAGAAIGWLRDGLGIIGQSAEIGPLAESVPDAGGMVAVPAFSGLGSPWWDPDARGTVLGITRGGGRAQLARAVVEAMAYSVRDMIDAMAAAGTACRELRADGGASAMALLLQLQADQLGIPVVRPVSTESTALGAALLAGLAEGVWGSPAETAALWRADRRCEPAADRPSADAAYAGWRHAVDRSRHWALAGTTPV